MTSRPSMPVARLEREALCDTLLALGPDAPTLCDPWRTRDLAAHLVLAWVLQSGYVKSGLVCGAELLLVLRGLVPDRVGESRPSLLPLAPAIWAQSTRDTIDVLAERQAGLIAVQARAMLRAPMAVVWHTLTDYEHLPAFIPGLASSRRVATSS